MRIHHICKPCDKAKAARYRLAKKNSKLANVPAPTPVAVKDLSELRIRHLAEWYVEAGYRHYSPAALAAGKLDAELRAILAREVGPERIEVEFARVIAGTR